MIYTDFQGEKLSQLGMGTMRLPVVDGDNANIDEAAALEIFDYAYKPGINYFDTAWGYHDGNAELVTGKALSRYPRESFYLTTKFPGYDRNNFPKVKEISPNNSKNCRPNILIFTYSTMSASTISKTI